MKLLEPVGVTLLGDGEGAFARAYAAKAGATFVIRPDGYIGYVADRLDRAGLSDFFKRSLGFKSPAPNPTARPPRRRRPART